MTESRRFAEEVFNTIISAHSRTFFAEIDRSAQGEFSVLRCLMNAEEGVSAGEIAEKSCVSSARMAVLLNRMEEKGLIEKYKDENDRRKTMVRATKKGSKLISERKQMLLCVLEKITEKVGREKISVMIETMREISAVCEEMEKGKENASAQEYM